MSAVPVRARARSLLRIAICAAVSLTAAWLLCATPATADCTTGGSSCLPGSGYGLTDVNWACGINTEDCYYDTTTDVTRATLYDWGWVSASYGGAGSVYVCGRGIGIGSPPGIAFIGCGYNLARVCGLPSCDDQDGVQARVAVQNQSGVTHTINGHAKG